MISRSPGIVDVSMFCSRCSVSDASCSSSSCRRMGGFLSLTSGLQRNHFGVGCSAVGGFQLARLPGMMYRFKPAMYSAVQRFRLA